MKILIAYYSKTGHTKRVAIDLVKKLKAIPAGRQADIDEIVDLKKRNGIWGFIKSGLDGMKGRLTEIKSQKKPNNYDLVLLGTPIWAGSISPAIKTYIVKNKNSFKKFGFFMTSGGSNLEIIKTQINTILEGKKVLEFEGWDDVDLKDESKYQEKLERFLERIKRVDTREFKST